MSLTEAPHPLPLRRRTVLAGSASMLASGVLATTGRASAPLPFAHTAKLSQGGWIMVRADPGSIVSLGGDAHAAAPADGLVVLGFDRDAPPVAELSLTVQGQPIRQSLAISPIRYSVQHINGLPDDQVAPTDPALLARIKADLAKKQTALASQDASESFRTGFVLPLDHAMRTSAFGPQRILNGVPKTPHYGVDLAAPQGAPIHAPADGLVVLAEPHMHFEGGLTLIDHGQGLVSMYLHQSYQDVATGQRVRQGQRIGAVGMTGRATGPHLCWRMTWRGRHMDPSLMVGAAAPA